MLVKVTFAALGMLMVFVEEDIELRTRLETVFGLEQQIKDVVGTETGKSMTAK